MLLNLLQNSEETQVPEPLCNKVADPKQLGESGKYNSREADLQGLRDLREADPWLQTSRDPRKEFSFCEFSKIFKNTFFVKDFRETTSVICSLINYVFNRCSIDYSSRDNKLRNKEINWVLSTKAEKIKETLIRALFYTYIYVIY